MQKRCLIFSRKFRYDRYWRFHVFRAIKYFLRNGKRENGFWELSKPQFQQRTGNMAINRRGIDDFVIFDLKQPLDPKIIDQLYLSFKSMNFINLSRQAKNPFSSKSTEADNFFGKFSLNPRNLQLRKLFFLNNKQLLKTDSEHTFMVKMTLELILLIRTEKLIIFYFCLKNFAHAWLH